MRLGRCTGPLPDPRDPRGVRYPLAVLLGKLLVVLAEGADTLGAVAKFTADHQVWFWRWLPLHATVPIDNTYRLWVPLRLRRLARLDLQHSILCCKSSS